MSKKDLSKFANISLKVGFEFSPVIIFIATYKLTHDFFLATAFLVIMTIIISVIMSTRQSRLPIFAILMCAETIFFGGLTILSHKPVFLQIRDTFYDFSMGLIILGTAAMGSPLLEKVFKPNFDVGTRAYIQISLLWGFFFIVGALMNEFVRKNYPPHVWVDYKTTMMFVTIFFGLSVAYVYKHKAAQFK
jgi:intracellular septation protein A